LGFKVLLVFKDEEGKKETVDEEIKGDGDNEIEVAQVDAAFEQVRDIRQSFFQARGDENKVKDYWAKTFGEAFGFLNKNAKGNQFTPWFTGKRMTYIDIAIYYLIWVLKTENKDAVEQGCKANAKLQGIYEAVEKDPKIAAYVAQRKVTPM